MRIDQKAPLFEPKRRTRWVGPEQVKVLLDKLPEYLVDLIKYSFCIELRKQNVTDSI